MDELDVTSVIAADLQDAYEATIEAELQRVFFGDIDNWQPTGLLGPLGDKEGGRDRSH